MSLRCDLQNVESIQDFYQQISQGLHLPDNFGRNLDALYDALTGSVSGPAELYWHDAIAARNDIGEDAFESLVATLHAARGEREDLRIWLGL